MDKIYLYGAGINCFGAIKFWKKENIAAVIDSNPKKWGTQIDGIDIISLEDYQKKKDQCCIVITAFVQSDDVICLLEQNNIYNYYVPPYMQAGFPNVGYIFDYYKVDQWKKIAILGANPFCELILDEARKRGIWNDIMYIVGSTSWQLQPEELGKKQIREKLDDDIEGVILTESGSEFSDGNKFEIADIFSEDLCNSYYPHDELKKFKEIHKGKRCFIIGNGPSLRIEDLNKIDQNGDISFGMNRIFLLYDKTDWRPDYFVVDDFNAYRDNVAIYQKMDNDDMFVREFYSLAGYPNLRNAQRYHSTFEDLRYKRPGFSDDISRNVYWGSTVAYSAMQIAAYMGFREIYLLGMDFNYEGRKVNRNIHFSEEYERTVRYEVNYKREQSLAYQSAELFSRNNGFRIYNATRGGALEIFERVDFDTLF